MVTFDPIVTQTFAIILVTICAICTKLITVATWKGKLGKITHKLQILSCKYNAIGICAKNKKKMSSWSYWHILACSYCESQGSGPSSQAYICHTSDHPPRGDSHTPCFWGHRSSAGSQPCSSHSSLSTERSQIEYR